MSETRTPYLSHPDEIAALQAAGANNTQREDTPREWAAGRSTPGNAAHIPMPAACPPFDADTVRYLQLLQVQRRLEGAIQYAIGWLGNDHPALVTELRKALAEARA